MKKVKSVSVVSCIVLAVALFLLSSSFAKEAVAQVKTLKIGLISSVTGPMAPAFKSELDAAKPAADLVNQKGGITVKGQKYLIEIVTGDDQSSPPGAVSAANKLMQEGIKFLISPMFVPSDMAIAPICEEAKVLRVCPNRNDPAPFGPPNHYSFNAEASIYNIPFVYDKLKTIYPQVKRIAIIWPDDPGAKMGTNMTEKEIKKRGLEVVFNEAYKIPNEDFYPILTKALAQKPDAIECIFAILPWAKGIINQSREMGFTGPITAIASFGDTNMLNGMIDPKYAYDICHASPDVTSPKMLPIVRDFGKLVEKETKEKFNFDHVLTLQALWVILQGIEKAQSFDTDNVVSALETMENIETPYGKGRFGGQDLIGLNRLMIRDIPFSRIVKGGKVEFEFLSVK
jgi:ABC-type branched-subunit amino acid transport system substrate-binding protein